ncbi:hypothetical protein ABZS66_25085, partial [Dactylosporangium sp. NPDC005572]
MNPQDASLNVAHSELDEHDQHDRLPQPKFAGHSPLRRAGVGVMAMALLATGGLTACKELPGTGAQPRPTVSGKPSTSAGPTASATPITSASPSSSASASASPTKSATTKPPTGGGGVPPTYTVAGFPAANNTGYPQGL